MLESGTVPVPLTCAYGTGALPPPPRRNCTCFTTPWLPYPQDPSQVQASRRSHSARRLPGHSRAPVDRPVPAPCSPDTRCPELASTVSACGSHAARASAHRACPSMHAVACIAPRLAQHIASALVTQRTCVAIRASPRGGRRRCRRASHRLGTACVLPVLCTQAHAWRDGVRGAHSPPQCAGLDTDSGYVYPVDTLDAVSAPEPTAVSTKDGDGTVNLRSLRVRPAPCPSDREHTPRNRPQRSAGCGRQCLAWGILSALFECTRDCNPAVVFCRAMEVAAGGVVSVHGQRAHRALCACR